VSAHTPPDTLPGSTTAAPAPAPAGLPRLLAGIAPDGAPLGLAAHLDVYGELPFARTRARTHTRPRMARKKDTATRPFQHWHDPADLVDLVTRSGLRGRGGGAFPTGEKLRAVASARARAHTRAVVLVNGAEGEPASAKDRTLLETLPHLVLDGAVLAAQAVGAEEIVLAVCESAAAAFNATAVALGERGHDAGAVPLAERGHDPAAVAVAERGHDAAAVTLAERAGKSNLPGARGRDRLAAGAPARRRGGEPPVRLLPVPARYVAGQESALVNLANGGPALPMFTPPYPFERGVRRRPTFVANVETLAHLALIARYGADWFRELGSVSQPGSALLTVSGVQLADPGVYEVEVGSPLSALLGAAGVRERPRAVLFGGYAGTWIDGAHLHGVALGDEQLAPYGATLGAGVVALLSPNACPVAELARVTRWLAAQSARQCGPCTFGLPTLADTVEQVALGRAPRHPERRLAQLASLVYRRGACSHPDGAARLVSSALQVFAEELADHAQHGPCAACERPSELPRPRAVSNVDDCPSGRRAGARAAAAGRGWRTAHADHELAGVR
jgi:NADH:ubiquinone oxidoreductase subunit F (NADH-binding)